MASDLAVMVINLRIRAMRHAPPEAPIELRQRYTDEG
jgi:hypothetical protein